MCVKSRTPIFAGIFIALAACSIAAPAGASVILPDTYYGGTDTWHFPSDVIGDPNTFGVTSATIGRTNGGNTLQITINTNYAGKPGTAAADGTGYGALFITPGKSAWTPQGAGPGYYTDTYQPGDWMYAATLPLDPSLTSGIGGLYLTSGGTIVMSNAGGHTQTYPLDPTSPYYFRANQAVQFTKGSGQTTEAGTSESWAIGAGTINFSIDDNGLLGNDFALSWAMTCANDIIQGQVDIPEPPTWSIFMAALLSAALIRARPRLARAKQRRHPLKSNTAFRSVARPVMAGNTYTV